MRKFLLSLVFTLVPALVPAEEITVIAAGDVYLGGRAAPFIERNGPSYPFAFTADIFGEGDMVIVNLESPLTEREKAFMEKEYVFKAGAGAAEALKAGGVDVATLANNHIMDYGAAGLGDTMARLDGLGIAHGGAGRTLEEARRPAVVEIKGVKVAVLAYSNTLPEEFYAGKRSPGTAYGRPEHVRADVRKAAGEADIVIVSFHWSEEGLKEPKDYQRELAHTAIDSGARLVLGHHPHVVQGAEFYNDGLILYSLGNFVFGSYSLKGPEGIIARVVFTEDGSVKSAGVIPIDVDNWEVDFRPAPLGGEVALDLSGGLKGAGVSRLPPPLPRTPPRTPKPGRVGGEVVLAP
ncbi:MAG: CapA family protein [Thermodesulfobacteriota bacterium]